jgi:transcription antitermination factor NusG
VVKEQAGLKPKQWVRIKRGVFKDDLAQVDYVDVASNQVSVNFLHIFQIRIQLITRRRTQIRVMYYTFDVIITGNCFTLKC